MASRRPQMELRAREPLVLGRGSYLAAGQRLTIPEGIALSDLLATEAQVSRFGRVVFDVVEKETIIAMTDHEDAVDPAEVAVMLRKVLGAVDVGEVTATDTERYRLEGAVAALEAQDPV